MVSSSLLSSFLRFTHIRKSSARVFSDSPTPSQAFEADLAASLQQLMTQGAADSSSDLLSFNWMCKALDVVLSVQSSAMRAVCERPSPRATHSDKGTSRISMEHEYMEDSAKMLDACFLLKEALAGADAYVKASHLALERLQGLRLACQGDVQRAKHALLSAKHVQERVHASARTNVKSTKHPSTCSSMLRRMGDKITAPVPLDPLSLQDPNTASMVPSALYAGEMCTIFFLRLLSTALSSPASGKASSSMTPLQMSRQAAAWAPSLLSLQAQLNSELLQATQKKTQSCTTHFPELHILGASMDQIYKNLLQSVSPSKQIDLKHLVGSTSMLIQLLQSSMARLEHQIGCLLSSLVSMRIALLH